VVAEGGWTGGGRARSDSQKRRVTFVSSLRSGDPNTRRLAYDEDMGLGGSLEAAAAPKSDGSAECLPEPGRVAARTRPRLKPVGRVRRGES
jgi:hypothetical protein